MGSVRFRGSLCVLVALVCFPRHVQAERTNYDGYQTVRVEVRTADDWRTLQGLTDDIWSPDGMSTDAVWGAGVGPGTFDVLVDPARTAAMQASGLDHEVLIANLGPVVAAQYAASEAHAALRGGTFDFATYHTLTSVHNRLAYYTLAYPGIAQVVSVGTSLQGRPLSAIRITGPGDASARPGFLFHGGQHAREWVNVPVPMYAAEWLLTNYGVDPLATRLVNEVEWFILPVMNPDGYEYTWTDVRLWRKNRRPNAGGSFGVDLNRNWGSDGWGGAGSSGSPSNETYRGTAPFSEPETQAVSNFILSHTNIAAYIDYHSYSQLAMWPFGDSDVPSDDDAEFALVMGAAVQRMRGVHDVRYVTGSVYTTIYPAAGASVDWVYGDNIPARKILAVTFELRDKGQTGFVLPENQILPTCEENLPAILAFGQWISAHLRVELVGDPVVYVPAGETHKVTARVTAHLGTFAQQQVSLFHRVDGAAYVETPMTSDGDGKFSAIVPPAACPGVVEYYVAAVSDQGRTVKLPLDTQDAPFSFRSGLEVHFADDAEADRGWQAGVPGDNAVRGLWERSDPVGNWAQPSDDHTPGSGRLCFNTDGRTDGTAVGSYDLDNGRTTLLAPVIDVAGDDPTVSFWYWYSNDQGGAPNSDVMLVEASNNGGSNWTEIMQISTNAQLWGRREFRLADFVAPTAEVRVRFVAQDLGTGSIVEAAIDDFAIEDRTCPAIDSDADGDGLASAADALAFSLCMNGPAGAEVTDGCGVFNFDLDTDVDLRDAAVYQQRVAP